MSSGIKCSHFLALSLVLNLVLAVFLLFIYLFIHLDIPIICLVIINRGKVTENFLKSIAFSFYIFFFIFLSPVSNLSRISNSTGFYYRVFNTYPSTHTILYVSHFLSYLIHGVVLSLRFQ